MKGASQVCKRTAQLIPCWLSSGSDKGVPSRGTTYEASWSMPKSDWSYRDCQRNSLGAKVLHKALRVAGPHWSLCLFGEEFKGGDTQQWGQCPPILKSATWSLPGQGSIQGNVRGALSWRSRGVDQRVEGLPPTSLLLPSTFSWPGV